MQITLMSPTSGAPHRYPPVRIFVAAAPTPEMRPQPGWASWNSTTALSSSAMLMILVPRTVIGEVVPVSGMGNTSTGTPALTSSIVAAVISRSCWSGAIVQLTVLKMGRSQREPPATASKISSNGFTCATSRTSSCRCLLKQSREIASISRPAVSGSRSRAEIDGHA